MLALFTWCILYAVYVDWGGGLCITTLPLSLSLWLRLHALTIDCFAKCVIDETMRKDTLFSILHLAAQSYCTIPIWCSLFSAPFYKNAPFWTEMAHSYKIGAEKRLHHFGTTAPQQVGTNNFSTRKIISAPFLKTALFSTQMAQSSTLAQSFFCAVFIRMRHFRSKRCIIN